MSSRAFLAALTFVLLGLGASLAATWVHYQLAATPDYVSFCDVNATFSCADAYQSAYGRVLGLPVAVLGVTYFLGLAALMTLGRGLEALAGYLVVAATIGLGVVLYYAWATVFVLGTLCLLCLATYVAVIGLFFVAGAAMPFPLSGLPARLSRDLGRLSSPVAIVALLVVASTALAGATMFPAEAPAATATAGAARITAPGTVSGAASGAASVSRQPAGPPLTDEQKAQVRRGFDESPRVIVPADAAGASVVIVKFNDYQCPPCRQTWEMYRPLKSKWDAAAPGRVKFISRDFPLEGECNPSAPTGPHPAACEAAVAVRLAREKNKADEMEAWLFARQTTLSPALVREGVQQVAGVTDFDGRYASVLSSVRNDTALGASLGVTSTPTFFINGVKVPAQATQVIDYIIEYELSKVAPPAK